MVKHTNLSTKIELLFQFIIQLHIK